MRHRLAALIITLGALAGIAAPIAATAASSGTVAAAPATWYHT